MAVHIPARRVTGPFGDEARARLRGEDAVRAAGYASSGSEHGAATCLSGLVHAFLETGGGCSDGASSAAADHGGDGGSDRDDSLENGDDGEDRDRAASETVRDLMKPPAVNSFRGRLAADVSKAVESSTWMRSNCGTSSFRRAVMARLRAAGYNAGICKARWDAAGGLSAGSYEYIDVVAPPRGGGEGPGRRYIVDLDFAAEFEVARATEAYQGVVAALPWVAVAGEDAMRQVVRAVADAARRSLRARGLHVPPWRKSRFMLAKWLGPYRRTTNPVPSFLASAEAGGDVKCRAVGFPSEALAGAAAARTR